jgi:hypothetical protein
MGVFLANVPIGLAGTILVLTYSLREIGITRKDSYRTGGENLPLLFGLTMLFDRYHPWHKSQRYFFYERNDTVCPLGYDAGWCSLLVLCSFLLKGHVKAPLFRLNLVPHPCFCSGKCRRHSLHSIARGGLQFMLAIWFAGNWLPLRGYDF